MAHRIADCSAGPAGGGGRAGSPWVWGTREPAALEVPEWEETQRFQEREAPPGSLRPHLTTSLLGSLFLQTFPASDRAATGRERPIGAGCVPDTRIAGSCGDPRRATRGRTHLAAAGRRTGDSTPGSGGWLRSTARRFVPPLRKAFPRATPTSRLCTLHHSRADVTAQSPGKLSPPPRARSPGVARALAVASSGHPVAVSGERFYFGARGGV